MYYWDYVVINKIIEEPKRGNTRLSSWSVKASRIVVKVVATNNAKYSCNDEHKKMPMTIMLSHMAKDPSKVR